MEKVRSDNPPPYSEAIKQTGYITTPPEATNQNPPGSNVPSYQSHPNNPNGFAYIPPTAPPPPVVGFVPTYGTLGTTTTVVTPEIVIIGGCPSCRIGVLEDNYPLCGICCAIAFFPLGILCCLAMKNKRCSNCGAEF